MQSNYTEEYLIRYLYNELSAEEYLTFSKELENDIALRGQYKNMLEAKAFLNECYAPNDSTVALIMEQAGRLQKGAAQAGRLHCD